LIAPDLIEESQAAAAEAVALATAAATSATAEASAVYILTVQVLKGTAPLVFPLLALSTAGILTGFAAYEAQLAAAAAIFAKAKQRNDSAAANCASAFLAATRKIVSFRF
jgi:hypothetical protein